MTLDELKAKIKRIDEIHKILEELDECPDPKNITFPQLGYKSSGTAGKNFLTTSTLTEVISVGLHHYKQQLHNELTVLMDEIKCSDPTTSVESQSSTPQTTISNVGQ